jgi:hypothetical protein
MCFSKHLAWLLLLGLMLPSMTITARAAEADNPAEGVASAEGIDELIKQLDADQYSQRQDAQEALIAIGKPAIEAVSQAATAGSLEVTSRSIDILKKLYQSSDEATKAAAEAALQKLADGDHPSSARRAKAVLKPKQEAGQGVPGAGRVIIGGAQFNILGGNKRVSVKTVNGVKTIEVQEGDKKTKIVSDPQQGIKAEVTTKKDGKETTEKIEAKNADELKKKNKEVYDLYQQYAKNNAMGQIQIQIGNIAGRAIPLQAQAGRPQRIQVDMAARLLKTWTQQIPRMTGDKELKGAPKESIDELQKQVDAAKGELAELEKRIQAKRDAAEKEAKDDAEEAGEAETPKDPAE